MANYKVPQDVEADDKILGPFSFRQFVYLMIVAGGIAMGWGLFLIFPPLIIIPLPLVLFFGALALPLRKDQPMEIYLAAILSFYLKPRKRLWEPDGRETLVYIAAPRISEPKRTKDISEAEADQRLRYLSELSDSRGWSVRGVSGPLNSSMNEDVFFEAQQARDMFDESSSVSQNFDQMISQSNQRRHNDIMNRVHAGASTPTPNPTTPPVQSVFNQPTALQSQLASAAPQDDLGELSGLKFNPYPTSINQAVIQPLSEQPANDPPPQPDTPQPTTPDDLPAQEEASIEAPSPDIIKLASNTDLSVETIAREANRITKKKLSSSEDEVVISLR